MSMAHSRGAFLALLASVLNLAAAEPFRWQGPVHPAGFPSHVHAALHEAPNALRVSWFVQERPSAGRTEDDVNVGGERPAGYLQRQNRGLTGERQVVQYGFFVPAGLLATRNGKGSADDVEKHLKHMSLARALPVSDYVCLNFSKPSNGCVGGMSLVGTLFTAEMTALPGSATRVYFRVGGGRADQWSDIYSIKLGRHSDSVNFVALGDMGTEENQPSGPKVAAAMANDPAVVEASEFILHVGDLAYAFTDHSRWSQWFDQMEPVASRVPYMVCPGNRDDDEVLDQRFMMPNDGGVKRPEDRNRWYSFDKRWVHVTAISTIHDFSKGSPQYQWLERDLAKAAARRVRGETAWIVVMGHTPMYSSSAGHVGGDVDLRMTVEPLFRQYGVDLTVWGDDHAYERSWPMFQGQPRVPSSRGSTQLRAARLAPSRGVDHFIDATGPGTSATVHMLVGTGGCGLDPWVGDQPDWSAYREISHGYTRISASPSHMRVQFVRVPGPVGDIGDEFVLESTRNGEVATLYGLSRADAFAEGGSAQWFALPLMVTGIGAMYAWRKRQQQIAALRSHSRVASAYATHASVC